MQQAMNVHTTVQQGRGRGHQLVVPLKAATVLAVSWGAVYPALLWSLQRVF